MSFSVSLLQLICTGRQSALAQLVTITSYIAAYTCLMTVVVCTANG